MANILRFPCQIDSVKTIKVKDCLKIILETDALSVEDKSILFSFGEKSVWVIMAEVPPKIDDLKIPDEILESKAQKSQSERIRSVLFVYWEKNKPTPDFDSFYRKKTEEFINLIKEKLE